MWEWSPTHTPTHTSLPVDGAKAFTVDPGHDMQTMHWWMSACAHCINPSCRVVTLQWTLLWLQDKKVFWGHCWKRTRGRCSNFACACVKFTLSHLSTPTTRIYSTRKYRLWISSFTVIILQYTVVQHTSCFVVNELRCDPPWAETCIHVCSKGLAYGHTDPLTCVLSTTVLHWHITGNCTVWTHASMYVCTQQYSPLAIGWLCCNWWYICCRIKLQSTTSAPS